MWHKMGKWYNCPSFTPCCRNYSWLPRRDCQCIFSRAISSVIACMQAWRRLIIIAQLTDTGAHHCHQGTQTWGGSWDECWCCLVLHCVAHLLHCVAHRHCIVALRTWSGPCNNCRSSSGPGHYLVDITPGSQTCDALIFPRGWWPYMQQFQWIMGNTINEIGVITI